MVKNKLIIIISALVVLSVIAISVEPVFAAVPTAPTNLTLHGNPTETSITLKWTQPTSGAPTGYKIFRASPLPNTFNQFGTYVEVLSNQTNVGAATVTYRNSALTAGQPFSWKVLAFNSDGDSVFSNTLGAGTIFANDKVDYNTGIQNFQPGQTFASNAAFTAGQTFSGAQTFGTGTSFGTGTAFSAAQTFGANSVFGANAAFTTTQTFGAGSTFGTGTAFTTGQAFTGVQTFTGLQDFAEGMRFFAGQTFAGAQDFISSSMKFGSGTSFNTVQTFGTGTNFTGAQTFVGANTFGASAVFGTGQTFPAAQTFGTGTNFTGKTDFATGQIFGSGAIFAKCSGAGGCQTFQSNESYDFTAGSAKFGNGTSFGAPRIFGTGTNFTGAQTFVGYNTFGENAKFGTGQTFNTKQNLPPGANFTGPATFATGQFFGENTMFADKQQFATASTFSFTNSTMMFGNGTHFGAPRTFGTGANFTGAQTFLGYNTFGADAKFGAAQTFPTKQNFATGANFTGPVTFTSTQSWGSGTMFADKQQFATASTFSFTNSTMLFGNGTHFGAPRTFGTGANFTGAQVFVGANTFGLASEFGAAQVFPNGAVQDFERHASFGKNTNFGNTEQVFKAGTSFDTGTTFIASQDIPANAVLATGLVLTALTCPDVSCTATAAQILSPGEFLAPGTDPIALSRTVSDSDRTISIAGLGMNMTFGNVTSAGTVTVDLVNPQTVTGASPGDVSGELVMTASNGNTLNTIGSIMEISVNATSGAAINTSNGISISLKYDEVNLGGVLETDLKMLHQVNDVWITENSCTTDTTANTITCAVTSLSPFGVGTSSSSSSSSSSSGGGGGGSCDLDGLGNTSLRVYEVSYDVDTYKVLVQAYSTCGPIKAKITTLTGQSILGMSADQPLLDDNIIIYSIFLDESDKKFTLYLENKRVSFTDTFNINGKSILKSYTGDTGYTSMQEGTSLPVLTSEQTTTESQLTEIQYGEMTSEEMTSMTQEESKEYVSEPIAEDVVATQESEENGGGCLIATATYGSELAPQVQQLRELRDNQLLNTESGSAFMQTFNEFYYSFSPTIADWERESPMFKEAVKLAITPMITSLSLMENAESESEVLGLGLSVIALNLGMYIGIPAVVIIGIKKKF